jgi:hypothetical protein
MALAIPKMLVRRGFFQTHPFTLKVATAVFAETLETFGVAYHRKPELHSS